MTTQELATTAPIYVGVPMMDATEAREIVTRIKTRIDLARGELLELHDREGWKALGYKSWQACASAEFGGSAAQMYRLLSAAQIERAIDSPIGEYPESHLREVAKLDTPEQQRQALEQAHIKAHGKPTARDVQAEVDAIAQRTPADLVAAGVDMRRHGAWFVAIGRDAMQGWETLAAPFDTVVEQARLEIARRAMPATPALDDILLRLDAHGYAKTTTRQKGMTTFYSFRNYASTSEPDEVELEEGQLPYWLAELDSHAAYAQQRQEKYLDARGRFERLGWRLEREGNGFALYQPGGKHHGTTRQLDPMIKTLEALERAAVKQAVAPPLTIEALNACMPKNLEAAGYYWKSAQPIVIAHADGWTGEAPLIATAITLASDREKAHDAPIASSPVPSGWWNCGMPMRAMQSAVNTSDRAGALHAALDLVQLFAGDNPKTRAAALLVALAREMKGITTGDQEGLSQAISDLNECEEGTEVRHWLDVGYALLDLEATE